MSECVDRKFGMFLHAYELNALAEEEAERFELHLLECEHCFREVETFGRELMVLRTDEGINAAARESSRENIVERFFKRFSGGRKTAVAGTLAMIATLLIIAIPVYLGLIKPAIFGGGEMQSVLFNDNRMGVKPLMISQGDKARIDIIFHEVAPDKAYLIEMMHLDDSLIVESRLFDQFDANGRGTLVVSLRDKKPGLYVLTMRDPNVKPAVSLREYTFRIMP
jgi:hypothetical protein